MSQITSGRTMYSRVVKDDDYGIKREMLCELSFAVGENENPDEIIAHVAQKCVEIVHEKLRLRSAAPAAPSVPAATQTTDGAPSLKSPGAAAGATAPSKEDAAAKLNAAEATKKATRAPKVEKPAEAPAKEADDDLNDLLGLNEKPAEPARKISDLEMTQAIQKKNAAIKNPKAITALKEKFVGPQPAQLRDLPAEKREQFLTELEALTA